MVAKPVVPKQSQEVILKVSGMFFFPTIFCKLTAQIVYRSEYLVVQTQTMWSSSCPGKP